MKATIHGGGTMIITPENELEIYALKKWSEENKNDLRKILIRSVIDEEEEEEENGR